MENKKKKTMIKLWGDHIVISSLFLGLFISLVLVAITFGVIELLLFYGKIAPEQKKDLIYAFGTLAIIVGFIINNIWIRPQRNVIEEKVSNKKDGSK